MSRSPIVKRKVRGFVITWSMLTLLVTGVTFFGIYLTYSPTSNAGENAFDSAAFPLPTTTTALIVADATALPTLVAATQIPPTATVTNTVEPTLEPTTESVVVAQVQESTATPEPTSEPTVTPTTSPINIDSFETGIQVQIPPSGNPDEMNNWYTDVLEKLAMKWVKIQVRWEYGEPEPGVYSLDHLAMALDLARQRGVHVMLSIVTAPEWSREPGVDVERHGPPADYQAYVNFVAHLMNEFGGSFHAIEVWNEQNLDREWTSVRGLRADDYVQLLRQTYQAVKQIDPEMIVISGALSTTGGCTNERGEICAIDDFTYFDAMLDAGMLNYTDCVGAHHNGYNLNPLERWDAVTNDPSATFRGPFDNAHHSWSFRSTLEYYATRVQAAGGAQKLCVTEFGWASGEDLEGVPAGWDYAVDNTLEEQRDWTILALDLMKEMGTVRLAFVWNLNYGPQAGWSPDNDNVPYSIIGPNFAHRPVYGALGEWGRANATTE